MRRSDFTAKAHPLIQADRDRVEKFYKSYVEQHGMQAGWSSMSVAADNYAVATDHRCQRWDMFESVLDVGSGQARFYDYLRRERGFLGTYEGIEILPMFHSAASRRLRDQSGVTLIEADFLAHDYEARRFDWVFSLGSLGVFHSEQDAHDLATVTKMLRLARGGVTVYLNDLHRMPSGRLEEVPDLVAHDIPRFVRRVEDLDEAADIEVCCSSEARHRTLVHVLRAGAAMNPLDP